MVVVFVILLFRMDKAEYPLAPANGFARSDEEALTSAEAEELRLKKRKRLTFFIIFTVSQIVMGIVFGLTIMKVKTPKFRVMSATFEIINVTSPSFNMKMYAEIGVKNPNFGPYKFHNTTIDFYYGETLFGSAGIPESKAGLKTTKKFNVTVDLIAPTSLASNSQFANEVSLGLLPLRSQSNLSGKVQLMLIMKKKRSIQMNCTMIVNIKAQQLQDVNC
ncbi:Late embryogenesis abundant protein [Camellia lanceoleosa]|uniref:Late embryogenesis abundant protein n=1 Tax=Camellia lanceoleosa TaxID=1840588 RepID=A0ACC0GXG2_9ERIC|nr:Late embryogenesis abundant protein [Camellia lanceoleosa]